MTPTRVPSSCRPGLTYRRTKGYVEIAVLRCVLLNHDCESPGSSIISSVTIHLCLISLRGPKGHNVDFLLGKLIALSVIK